MVLTKYSYTKDTDLNRLTKEIVNNPSILVALDHIDNLTADQVDIWLKDQLTVEQKIVLDDIIASHINVPLPNMPVIQNVKIQEEAELKTGGHFQVGTLDVDIPSGEVGDVSKHYFSFPFPIAILEGELLISEDLVGDVIHITIAPDTVIGVLTQSVNPGDTKIYVSNTAVDNAWIGVHLELTNGSTRLEKLGRVLEIESDYIIMENPAQQDHSPADPTYIRMTAMFVHDFRIPNIGRVEVGTSKIGASYVPANTVFGIEYINNTGLAKKFGVILEYLY